MKCPILEAVNIARKFDNVKIKCPNQALKTYKVKILYKGNFQGFLLK